MALVEEPKLRLLKNPYFHSRIGTGCHLFGREINFAGREERVDEVLDYDPIYQATSEWRILPAIDHPEEPSRCLVSGTGLTHLGSARGRQKMHSSASEELTDSMKMFRWGIGRRAPRTAVRGNLSGVVLQG